MPCDRSEHVRRWVRGGCFPRNHREAHAHGLVTGDVDQPTPVCSTNGNARNTRRLWSRRRPGRRSHLWPCCDYGSTKARTSSPTTHGSAREPDMSASK
jgi:hypothetical protein